MTLTMQRCQRIYAHSQNYDIKFHNQMKISIRVNDRLYIMMHEKNVQVVQLCCMISQISKHLHFYKIAERYLPRFGHWIFPAMYIIKEFV